MLKFLTGIAEMISLISYLGWIVDCTPRQFVMSHEHNLQQVQKPSVARVSKYLLPIFVPHFVNPWTCRVMKKNKEKTKNTDKLIKIIVSCSLS